MTQLYHSSLILVPR
uniref:Uncharacterized protein n=1 Tax=Anguilla anguilla TaxID=7936 RepID=A0A0E9TQI4_ANGAN